jgi:uncharacterized protein (DUF952 family)
VPRLTLHLVADEAWPAHAAGTPIAPPSLAEEGFVHCTDGDDEMVAVANRFYRSDPRSFLVLTVDLDRAGSPWRFDDAERRYPHVYGPIHSDAVLAVRPAPRDEAGRFLPLPLAGG